MYKKILVPVDLTRRENAEKLCKVANNLATQEACAIRLVTVMPDYGMPLVGSYFPADAQEKQTKETMTALKEMAGNITGDVSTKVHTGNRASQILTEAKNWNAELIIMGSRKKASQGGKRVFGSCSSSVANRAGCSVLIVRNS